MLSYYLKKKKKEKAQRKVPWLSPFNKERSLNFIDITTCFQYLWEHDFTILKTNKCEQKVGIQFSIYLAYFSLLFPFPSPLTHRYIPLFVHTLGPWDNKVLKGGNLFQSVSVREHFVTCHGSHICVHQANPVGVELFSQGELLHTCKSFPSSLI